MKRRKDDLKELLIEILMAVLCLIWFVLNFVSEVFLNSNIVK